MAGTSTITPLTAPRDQAPPVTHSGYLSIAAGARRLWSWLAVTKGHGIWIVLWTVIGFGGTFIAPFLGDHPLLMILAAPRLVFLALAADSVDLVTFVLFGTVRLGVTDASYFIVGRRIPWPGERPGRPARRARWHRRLLSLTARITDGAVRWLCRRGYRAGVVLFLRPNSKYLGVAGAYGVSAAVAAAASVLGTIAYLASLHLGIGLLL